MVCVVLGGHWPYCYYQERIKERERVTYASATVRAKSKTTTINRTILENAHYTVYTACTMECNHTWPVLFIVVGLDFARTVADA